jgi:DNA ligase-1
MLVNAVFALSEAEIVGERRMNNDVKPMLAPSAKQTPAFEDLKYPLYASAKIDGIRAIVKDEIVLSRTLKPIPNRYVQDWLGRKLWDGLDGELTVGPPNAQNCMQATESGVMTEAGEPDFTWWVFDFWTRPGMPFEERRRFLMEGFAHSRFQNSRVKCLPQARIETPAELEAFEQQHIELGFEGIMIRSQFGPYKYGRATAKQATFFKVKRFEDGEAIVVGFEEMMHNDNEQTIDERGYAKRSSHKENMRPAGVLGVLICADVVTKQEVRLGSGFTMQQRKDIWNDRNAFVGKIASYKHFARSGVKDNRRIPIFKGFRDPRNM